MHLLETLTPSMMFPVTICVICYGENLPLAERFVSSLYRSTAASLFNLRVGLNEVEPGTIRLFEEYAARFGNIKVIVEPRNVFKSPLMRRLFYETPLSSRWTVWCDDDTHFQASDWLQRLALRIGRHPEVMLWGQLFSLCRDDSAIKDWIAASPWYRGLPYLEKQSPSGTTTTFFRFATGGFWAIRTEILRMLNWPDCRLVQAHDDFLLGEALRQNDLAIGDFHAGVRINDAPRRNAQAAEVITL